MEDTIYAPSSAVGVAIAVLRVSGAITAGAGADLIIRNANTGVTELSGGGSWTNTRVYNGTLRLGANNGIATDSRLIVGNAGLFEVAREKAVVYERDSRHRIADSLFDLVGGF